VNCKDCESRLSEHLDGTLQPADRARVAAHLRACVACSTSWKALKSSMALLRRSGRDEPPPGLEEAILETLGSGSVDRASTGRYRGALPGFVALRRMAAIVAVTVALVALVLERARSRTLEGRVLAAEETLSSLRLETDGERERILSELTQAVEKVRAAGEEASRGREALASETRTREGLEARLALLEDSLRGERERIAELETRIADGSDEAARLALQDVEQPRVESPARAPGRPRAAARSEAVVVRRSGGRLEIETSGPRDEVVPKLLELARSDSDPEVSSLALSSVESLIGAGRPPAAAQDPEGKAGVKQWFDRRVSGLSSMTPPFLASSADADVPVGDDAAETERSARLRRLEELERLWEAIRKGSS